MGSYRLRSPRTAWTTAPLNISVGRCTARCSFQDWLNMRLLVSPMNIEEARAALWRCRHPGRQEPQRGLSWGELSLVDKSSDRAGRRAGASQRHHRRSGLQAWHSQPCSTGRSLLEQITSRPVFWAIDEPNRQRTCLKTSSEQSKATTGGRKWWHRPIPIQSSWVYPAHASTGSSRELRR